MTQMKDLVLVVEMAVMEAEDSEVAEGVAVEEEEAPEGPLETSNLPIHKYIGE